MVKALNSRRGLTTGMSLVSIVNENGNISSSGGMDNTAIGNTTRSTARFTTLDANSAVTFTANTSSGSTGTGTLVVTGGVGISQNVFIGGTLDSAGTASLNALTIKGNSLVIGNTAADASANGGGITLTGTTNKTILWDSANTNWTSNQHWNLASGKEYKINNTLVLNATTLGSGVTASSLTSVGTLTTGTWTASVISATYLDSAVARLAGPQTHSGTHTFSSQLVSSVSTGTAPFSVASTTKVTNLNADQLDGLDESVFYRASNPSNYITAAQTTSASGGDVTWSATALSSAINATIASNAVTFAKFQDIATTTVVGRSAGGSGDPTDLSMTTLGTMLNGVADPITQYMLEVGGTVTNPQNTEQTLSAAAATIGAWDCNSGQIATVTLGSAGPYTMPAPTNLKRGVYILYVKQDGTGGRLINTWNAVYKFPGAVKPVLSTGANAVDIISFICDGTNLYGSYLPDVR